MKNRGGVARKSRIPRGPAFLWKKLISRGFKKGPVPGFFSLFVKRNLGVMADNFGLENYVSLSAHVKLAPHDPVILFELQTLDEIVGENYL